MPATTVHALIVTGRAELWMIIVLEALNGAVSAFTMTAMTGEMPQIVDRAYLRQANALLSRHPGRRLVRARPGHCQVTPGIGEGGGA